MLGADEGDFRLTVSVVEQLASVDVAVAGYQFLDEACLVDILSLVAVNEGLFCDLALAAAFFLDTLFCGYLFGRFLWFG